MNTAVTINLDYLLCSSEACQATWKIMHHVFVRAGFELQERMFTIALPRELAAPLAEQTIREAADLLQLQDISLSDVLRACFTFEYQTLTTLDVPRPGNQGIEVSFMETGAFPSLQGIFTAH